LKNNNGIYAQRRKKLVQAIRDAHGVKDGTVLLFADFEQDRVAFRQESSFYYLTGLNEPGVALTIDLAGGTTLHVPNCVQTRAKWVASKVLLEEKNASKVGVDHIAVLGDALPGYQIYPFSGQGDYAKLLEGIKNDLRANKKIFAFNGASPSGYMQQRLILSRFCEWLPELRAALVDISPQVAAMRCLKDNDEIEAIQESIAITQLGQEAAAQAIKPGMFEAEVQASLEYVMIAAGARPAFPSIVGSGINSTVLHYMENKREMEKGDLVVVDIGAEFNFYCADLTRTYPVSGTFTPRQKEIYSIVLETQQYIADIAQPGYWLSNKDHADKSLNHLARAFLEKKGYGQYFPHGIGHYLGLDVHDVGDYSQPLQEGDVITIEPGIYIPQEKLGVRIEDNYWIVKGGAVCLSEDLPRRPHDVEQFIQRKLDEDEELEYGDVDDEDYEEEDDSN
jgi:Xaa-Pro aminopeptidase